MFKLIRSPEDEPQHHSAPDSSAQRGDARVDDVRRFAADVERADVERADVEGLAAGIGSYRPDRIDGLDRTGTALAVVDSVGRFVDIELLPAWWTALGPARVAAGLLEALASARLKAALVPLIIRRHGVPAPCEPPLPQPLTRATSAAQAHAAALNEQLGSVGNELAGAVGSELGGWDGNVLARARARLAAANRLIDAGVGQAGDERPIGQVVVGPRGLFRLHVRGSRIVGADLIGAPLAKDDTERLVADARDAIMEHGRVARTLDYRERL
ncbi:MAG TPA: hypothetical protein VGB74_19405 [Actinoplanes sp.]